MSNCNLIHGDSREILPTIEEKFDCCIVDPPYSTAFVGKFYQVLKRYQEKASLNKKRESNTWNWLGVPGYWSEQYYKTSKEFEDFTSSWMREVHRLLLPGSFFACFGCHKLINVNINIALSHGFLLKDILVWEYKPSFSKGYSLHRIDGVSKHCKTITACSYEPILLFQKHLEGNNESNYEKYGTGFIDTSVIKSNILKFNKPSKSERKDNPHYSVKPIELMKVLCQGLRAKRIIDPFAGSGTLGIVCKELNLDYVGIELEKEFFDYGIERLNDVITL